MRSLRVAALTAAACALGAAGCSGGAVRPGEPRVIACPAAPGSQAPNLAAGLDGRLYLSWIEPAGEEHALRYSTWSDGGWSSPRTVATGGEWFVNWADVPSMAALEDGTLAAHWLVRSGDAPYAYDVVVSLSRDEGASWGAPLRPHRDGTATEHGFVSLVPSSDGVGILWLDGRKTADTPPGATALRYAVLLPEGELRDEAEVDDSVCDCCSTDAVRTGDGAILAAYRDRTAAEVRDISVSRLEGSTWSAPRTVSADNWEILACPVNGPAVAARDDHVAVAWFTAAQGSARVKLAFSRNGGRSFDSPLRVDLGSPLGRVDVLMLDDGSALVIWLEREAGEARILLRQVTPSRTFPPRVVASTSEARASGFPRAVRFGDEIVLAWTQAGDPPRIKTATLSL